MTALLHDLHIGVLRSAGTTPSSAAALREYLLAEFGRYLNHLEEDLIILGDLFDTYQVPMYDLLKTYKLLDEWLFKGHKLTLVVGNHDCSNDSSKLSSFAFLAGLLSENVNVKYVVEPQFVEDGIYVVPHLMNQDLLDLAIAAIPECGTVLFHCNYDNFFAREADHSLNVSQAQAKAIPAKVVYFAHEHHFRTDLKKKVVMGGNQWPSSVADCLEKRDKISYFVNDGNVAIRSVTWDKEGYAEMDWRNLEKSDAQFIRITGHALPENAADMANAIARYRKDSPAFVVSNAVKVGESEEAAELTLASLELVRGFDVLDAVKKLLTVDDITIIESLA